MKKKALLQADISSLVRSHVLLQWADRTPPCPAPPTLRQASRGQPSMEEIFLFRWGLREGAQNGITEEEYNAVWHALRATPIRPTFRRRQSNLAVMCKDTYLPGEDFGTIFLRGMEIGGDSSVSAAYIPNIWSQWRKFLERRGIMKRYLAVKGQFCIGHEV